MGRPFAVKIAPSHLGMWTAWFLGPTKFKVACLVRPSVSEHAPLYLADDCCLVSDSTQRSLRSADVPTCEVPRTLSSYVDRTFVAAGPHLWNSLSVQLRNLNITYGLFRRQLKVIQMRVFVQLCRR